MRHPVARLTVSTLLTFGLSAAFAPAVQAEPNAAACKQGYLCLFEGPQQTGRVLLAVDAKVTKTGFDLRELDDIEPAIFPRSVRNPLPDGFGCIVRLNDRPDFAGEEQEVSGYGNHELDGRRVGSLTPDCG
ncbi:peptidase inhibitor family I36 protein [Kitasatospora sp. NPDC052896]|uniref:peptidase inhibitor family I36 protein n=1 Tax=Kitasatospora sp. NPDC052896 TaxID=3364061 RepID=UPI0037C585EF